MNRETQQDGGKATISSSTTRFQSCRLPLTLTLLFCLGLLVADNSQAERITVVEPPALKTKDHSRTPSRLGQLMRAARPSIGTPYKWGGTQLTKGIDCSNFTWQLYRQLGLPYPRYLGTEFMARIHRNGAFRRVPFTEAQSGDLLVYGYKENAKWHGHVVILIDKDGSLTGHEGLALGAHGGSINAVAYITFQGFKERYFKHKKMKLVNVLRIDGFTSTESPD